MTTEARLLTAAEARIRTAGYHGFSFRDIARDTGLTNAGVHHHFPTKADLVHRLAAVYTERFADALDSVPPGARVARLRALFSESLRRDGRMCLCGLLAAEAGGLPPAIAQSARRFFDTLAERLAEAFSSDAQTQALTVLARLEGAALVARALDDMEMFDKMTADLA